MNYKVTELDASRDWKTAFQHAFADSDYFVCLDSHQAADTYDWICAGEALEVFEPETDSLGSLRNHRKMNPGWWFGRINYDLKNELERLTSENEDRFNWSNTKFFEAGFVVTSKAGKVHLQLHPSSSYSPTSIQEYASGAKATLLVSESVHLTPRLDRDTYISSANSLLRHIQRGDIYEINYCQEFYADEVKIHPAEVYGRLQKVAEPPMSALWHAKNEWVLSMSPERYLKKAGSRLISQPIKGTARRSADLNEDKAIAEALFQDEKERAENVMIVDLVRNDLSRVAVRESVEVTELFGIHSFRTVHQMISTVECDLKDEHDIWDAIRATFPMGSMTGAPKVRAMQLSESHESHARGIYSGAIGYIDPNDDFDFNVVIRSVVYDSDLKYLSVSVGSALTSKARPAAEWDECLLKLKALKDVLSQSVSAED